MNAQQGGPAPPDAVPDDRLTQDELKGATVSGVRWTAISRVIYEVLALGASIALARLVSPAETGAAAVALVVPMLATILTFEGFGSALVQRERLTPHAEGVALTLSLVAGAVLFGVSALFAATLGPTMFGERTASLLLMTSVSFVVASVATVPRARAQRGLNFRLLSMNDVIGFASNIAVAIPLAALGTGGVALVGGALVGQLATSAAYVRGAGLPRPAFSFDEARRIAAYGVPASGAGVIFSLRKAAPWVVMGATLPAAVVGQFYRAFQLGAEYQSKVSNVMIVIVFPLFSRAAHDRALLKRLRGRIVRVNALLLAPALGLLALTAPEVVYIMYGPAWAGAAEATRILAGVGLAAVLMAGTEAVALGLGYPRRLLVFHAVFAITYVAALAVAATTGDVVTVALAALVVHALMLAFSQAFMIGPLLGLPFRELWSDAAPAVLSAAAAAAVAWYPVELARGHVNAFVVIAVGLAVGALVYALALKLCFRREWQEVRAIPVLLRNRSSPADASGAEIQ